MKQPTFIVLMTVLCIPVLFARRRQNSLRIVHGVPDIEDKYPYVIILANEEAQRFCIGTLITPEWVVTAGHCILETNTIIQYNFIHTNTNIEWDSSRVIKKIRHPSFTANLRNDIALLQVLPVPMRAFAKISTVDYSSLIGHAVEYAGYGMNLKLIKQNKQFKEQMYKDRFREREIGEGVLASCASYIEDLARITNAKSRDGGPFVCVVPKCSKNMQTAVNGDSGGSLFCDNKLIAIASWMPLTQVPFAGFTPVSPYLTWIYTTINFH